MSGLLAGGARRFFGRLFALREEGRHVFVPGIGGHHGRRHDESHEVPKPRLVDKAVESRDQSAQFGSICLADFLAVQTRIPLWSRMFSHGYRWLIVEGCAASAST
jgi:hypothetical protein